MKRKWVLFLTLLAFGMIMLCGTTAYAYNYPDNACNIHEYDSQCNHSFLKTYSIAPTCTVAGYDEYECSKCESYYSVNTYKSHSYSKVIDKAEAETSSNCGYYGYTYMECTMCGAEKAGSRQKIAYPESYKLSKTSYTYDGKAKKPTVTVKDCDGKTISSSYYTVTYSNNTKPGKAKATIKFKKKYSGKINLYYKIKPSKVSSLSVKYNSTGKMTVKWKKNTSGDGYILQYSPSSKFKRAQTCTVIIPKNSTTSKTISSLPAKKYYVRVAAYKSVSSHKYKGAWSDKKNIKIKQGVSLKAMINYTKTDLTGRDAILKFTHNSVDIKKYGTTYDRIKAIYDWHSKNNTKYFADCMECNMSFNDCLSCLYGENKAYDDFIWLAAGNFKNNDGSTVMHKWSVVYVQGVAYIFDPRLQGYTANKTGTTYFGVSMSSGIAKNYLLDGCWFYWSQNKYLSIV